MRSRVSASWFSSTVARPSRWLMAARERSATESNEPGCNGNREAGGGGVGNGRRATGAVECIFLNFERLAFRLPAGRREAGPCLSLVDALDQQYLLVVVDFAEFHFDDFTAAGRYMLANVGGLNRQLAMPAVNQNCQLHAAWTTVIKERVQCGADRAAGVEHVVAEDHVAAFDVDPDGAWSDYRTYAGCGKIISIKLNVEHPGVDRMLLDA